MIETKVKIHDKFSVEFKVGYNIQHGQEREDFALNMWIFVPNSLDINPQTYTKEQFYRDIKSNVRLITPIFLLREITGGTGMPFRNLKHSFHVLASSPLKENVSDYEYQIKMFTAIFKSSLRDEMIHICSNARENEIGLRSAEFEANIREITGAYRQLRQIINVPTVHKDILNYYLFGDEFISNVIEKYTFRYIRHLQNKYPGKFGDSINELTNLIIDESQYRKKNGYPVITDANRNQNRSVIFRYGVLKKYIESDLFLNARKKRDGVIVEQVYLSLAAGISMIFATIIAFSVQQRYGNFTMPLFVALVVSYMLKDRIKELMRYYFAHRLGGRYFDNKTLVSLKENEIGWIKEGVDFITEDKVPREVMDMRNRSPLLKAENRIHDEKILLYRKLVRLETRKMEHEDIYAIEGINDIIRLHLTTFLNKMDNPEESLYIVDEDRNIAKITGDKIYYMNIVIQMQHDSQLEYQRYRLVINRAGIKEIEHLG